jgi:hypothetical protein
VAEGKLHEKERKFALVVGNENRKAEGRESYISISNFAKIILGLRNCRPCGKVSREPQ